MELLARFAAGDVDAFETLFRQFQSEVYRWIVRMVRDAAVAEELTVDTFWRIYRARARFDPSREFGAWARRIAANVALDHLSAVRRQAPLPDQIPAGKEPDPVLRREVRDGVRCAVSELPPKLQAVAILALIEEQPYREIAEALGIPVATVKTREFRAVRLLRQSLTRMGIQP